MWIDPNGSAGKIYGDFELIEEITMTEDTDVIKRDKEPDGTSYNFRKVFVTVTGLSHTSSNTLTFELYEHGNKITIYQQVTLSTSNKRVTFMPICENGAIANRAFYSSQFNARDVPATLYSEIVSIWLRGNLTKDAVVRIYGVRS